MSSPSPWTPKLIYSSVPEQEKLHQHPSCPKWKPIYSSSWSSSWWTASATKRYPGPVSLVNTSQAVHGFYGRDCLWWRNGENHWVLNSLPRLVLHVGMHLIPHPGSPLRSRSGSMGRGWWPPFCACLWHSASVVDSVRIKRFGDKPEFKSQILP